MLAAKSSLPFLTSFCFDAEGAMRSGKGGAVGSFLRPVSRREDGAKKGSHPDQICPEEVEVDFRFFLSPPPIASGSPFQLFHMEDLNAPD